MPVDSWARLSVCCLGSELTPCLQNAALEQLQQLPFIRATLAESLRLYPQPPILIRRALSDDTLPPGLRGPAGGFPIGKVRRLPRSCARPACTRHRASSKGGWQVRIIPAMCACLQDLTPWSMRGCDTVFAAAAFSSVFSEDCALS